MDDDDFDSFADLEMEMMREQQSQAEHIPDDILENVSAISSVKRVLPMSQISSTGNISSTPLSSTRIDDSISNESPSRKRSLVEDALPLLNANNLEESVQQRPAKRKKPLLPEVRGCDDPLIGRKDASADPDLAIIERIKWHREERNRLALVDKGVVGNGEGVRRDVDQCAVHHHIPDGAFQSITTTAGCRLYLSVSDELPLLSADEDLTSELQIVKHKQLLSVPYSSLKEEALAELQRKSIQESRESAAEVSEVEVDDGVDKTSLWTDIYRPKHYLHLLSDEMTNRTVLYWMKMWDKIVFGRERKKKEKNPVDNQKFKDGKFNPKFSKYNQIVLPDLKDELEEDGRPPQKVLLLNGPPGLGKTTLAHIIAHHAGYNAVELNASDDRSIDAFRASLENATSMRSVLDKERRPNCLIIDEIDGAPAPSIKLLVNFITGKGLGGKAPPKKTKKEKVHTLKRPVIAICNDLYVPALKPLRQVALVINFPPILSDRLAQRLQEISKDRGLATDLTCLIALAHKTHNDIRSCLSLLQFVRNKHGVLKLSDLDGAAVGLKDYQQSLFSVWQHIFSVPKPVKVRHVNPHELGPPGTVLKANNLPSRPNAKTKFNSRCNDVLHAAQSCSEYEKLLQGWFENFPNSKFKHMYLEPVTAGLEWAAFLDITTRQIHTNQSWVLQRYLGHVFVALHLQFANHQKQRMVFPVQQNECATKLIRSEAVINQVFNQMSPSTRVYVTPRLLVTELMPYMCLIVQPNFRPVNTQLYSAKEKMDLFHLINTMIAYSLTFTQEKQEDGRYAYLMEPNVEDVVKFPLSEEGRRPLSYTARQLVGREVEMERVRRSEAFFSEEGMKNRRNPLRDALFKPSEEPPVPPPDTTTPPTTTAPPTVLKDSHTVENVPNHLKKLVAKPVLAKTDAKQPRDFFGRVIHLSASQQQKTAHNSIIKSDIWFKFKEGYSNAVRRSLKLKEMQ